MSYKLEILSVIIICGFASCSVVPSQNNEVYKCNDISVNYKIVIKKVTLGDSALELFRKNSSGIRGPSYKVRLPQLSIKFEFQNETNNENILLMHNMTNVNVTAEVGNKNTVTSYGIVCNLPTKSNRFRHTNQLLTRCINSIDSFFENVIKTFADNQLEKISLDNAIDDSSYGSC